MKKLTFSLIGFVFLLFAFSAQAASGIDVSVPSVGEACSVDADCDDGVYCNGIESCSSESSACVAGEDVVCDVGECNEDIEGCAECEGDLDCLDEGTPFCSDTLECVECLENLDCSDGEICELGECTEESLCNLFIKPSKLNLKKGVKPVKQMFTIKGVKGEEGFDPDAEIDFGPCEIVESFVAGDSDVLKVRITVPDNATFEGDFLDVQVGECVGQVFLKKPNQKQLLKAIRKQEKKALKEQKRLEKEAIKAAKKAAKEAAKEAKKNK